LRALSGRLITAQEDERRRVARELHDDLGQRAALMTFRVSKLQEMREALPDKAQEDLGLLGQDAQYISAGLRDVSHQLHPSTIADLGLETALRGVVEQMQAQGTDISFVARDISPAISSDVSTALYRIAQEALRNAVQHAPGAPVLVTLEQTNGDLRLSVEDPGPGFDLKRVSSTGGLGLLSIQERARLLGGTLEMRTAPDQGTAVIVRVPTSH
jgi:two-component system, chemotaxis family, CheB/CheR fusion protein